MNHMKNRLVTVFAALVLLLTAGCGAGQQNRQTADEPSEKPTAAEVSAEPETVENTTPAEATAEPEQMPAPEITIEDYIKTSGTYTDSVGNESTYSYALPMVTGVESETVLQFNLEMQQLDEQYIEPELANMKDGLSLFTFRSVYHWACRDGIYSIVVSLHNDWGLTEYHCCNFNENGDAVTNEQLLNSLNISPENLLAQMKERPGAHASTDVPMFMTQSGCLGAVLTCDSVAGADHYDRVMIYRPESGFTMEQLCEMALDQYESVNGYRPGSAPAEEQSDGTIAIQLCDDMGDHISTSDWYTVDPLTGTGTDVMGNPVDLTFY